MRKKNKPMGRGLSAILNAESKANINTANDEGAKQIMGNIVEINIDDIYPNPNQPRISFDQDTLQQLSQSIKNLGVIQPITLRKDGDKFEIISGERRYRASKMAGLETIPAYIRLVNDQELLEMALVENIQREDLDAIEIALTYQRLLEEIGMTQENLSHRIGKDRSTITNALRLLKLSPEMQNAIRTGVISAGHGRSILSLEEEELQNQLFERIIKEQLNVRQTEMLAKSIKSPKKNATTTPRELPNHLRRTQKSLSDLLDIKVDIKASKNGKKGKIVLDFNNEEELERILNAFEK